MKHRAQPRGDRIGAREQLAIGLRAAAMEQGGPRRIGGAGGYEIGNVYEADHGGLRICE